MLSSLWGPWRLVVTLLCSAHPKGMLDKVVPSDVTQRETEKGWGLFSHQPFSSWRSVGDFDFVPLLLLGKLKGSLFMILVLFSLIFSIGPNVVAPMRTEEDLSPGRDLMHASTGPMVPFGPTHTHKHGHGHTHMDTHTRTQSLVAGGNLSPWLDVWRNTTTLPICSIHDIS